MAVPNDFAMVEQLAAEGYFEKARQGDHRACGLFARLVAYRLNPTGDPGGWGWLTKQPGEAQVDGYSEDSIVYGNNPRDFQNVRDVIGGAGRPGATLAWQPQPRRPGNEWERPKSLTALELNYLKAGSASQPGPTLPKPCPDPSAHLPKPVPVYPGDHVGGEIGAALFADYAQAGQLPNEGMSIWMFRTAWDAAHGLTMAESINKHRQEWRRILGL